MRQVSEPIREGSEGFLKTQYTMIFRLAVLMAIFLFVLYLNRGADSTGLSQFSVASFTAISFLTGCLCSGLSGYVGMWSSVRANVRVASVARRSYHETIQVCMRSGAFCGVIVVALTLIGIAVLFILAYMCFGVNSQGEGLTLAQIPLLLVGYCFGASFVALFAQLGGGIYTKAADVGADLAGKIEASIPEDDPRNPAVVADLVGDNVGDCAGRGADLFESISAEIISAMMGGSISQRCKVSGRGFVFFPLVIHAFDLVVSSIGSLAVRLRKPYPQGLSSHSGVDREGAGTPLQILMRGFMLSWVCSLCTFGATCKIFLSTAQAPSAWWHFYVCD